MRREFQTQFEAREERERLLRAGAIGSAEHVYVARSDRPALGGWYLVKADTSAPLDNDTELQVDGSWSERP